MSLVSFIKSKQIENLVAVKSLDLLSDVLVCTQLAESWGGKLCGQSEDTGNCTIDVTFEFSCSTHAHQFKRLLDAVPITNTRAADEISSIR